MKFFKLLSKLISGFGIYNVNLACDWVLYQPKVPESLKKYKKR